MLSDSTGPAPNYWGNLATRAFAELLIDCEEERTLRAAHQHAAGRRQVGGEARTSDVGFRFLLELSDLDRHS
jgi:hypothetical protein